MYLELQNLIMFQSCVCVWSHYRATKLGVDYCTASQLHVHTYVCMYMYVYQNKAKDIRTYVSYMYVCAIIYSSHVVFPGSTLK